MSKKKLKTQTDTCLTGTGGETSALGEEGDEEIVTPFDCVSGRHGKW